MKYRLISIDRILKGFIHEEIIIISHGNKSSGISKTYKGNLREAQTMILLGVINSVEMSPKKMDVIIHFNNGFKKILNDEYSDRSDVPYVVFSDNHEIDAYPNYRKTEVVNSRPFTWLRGDLSFETLRLAFIDPSSRIELSNTKPN